jgi:hypothetical protein
MLTSCAPPTLPDRCDYREFLLLCCRCGGRDRCGVVVFSVARERDCQSQAVGSYWVFMTSAILAVTCFYVQFIQDTPLEIRAENLRRVPDIK